jgi:hypothetical protein
MAEETKGEVIGTEAQEGPSSPYILMPTHKSLASCFRSDFSIGLGKEWSNPGLKGLLSKFHKPLVPLCLLTSHCNMRSLKMMDGKRLSTRQSPNIVVGLIYPCLLLRLLTPLSKLLPTHQCSPLMLAKGLKPRPTMPLTKENPLLPLPHPPMALTNPCLPGCI